jgi:hypothetical protein
MEVSLCQLCKEPIWNFLCVNCLSRAVGKWLPGVYAAEFSRFHNNIARHFHYDYRDSKGYNYCIRCKNAIESPVCPYCYINEVFLWLRGKNPDLASVFIKIFNFDFEKSGHKDFIGIHATAEPITEDGTEHEELGICDECGEYSDELRVANGRWVCLQCSETAEY